MLLKSTNVEPTTVEEDIREKAMKKEGGRGGGVDERFQLLSCPRIIRKTSLFWGWLRGWENKVGICMFRVFQGFADWTHFRFH